MPSTATEVDELTKAITEDETGADNQDTDKKDDSESGLEIKVEETEIDSSDVKLTPAERSANEQENNAFAKIVAGKKHLSDYPDWLQDRLKARINTIPKEKSDDEIVEAKVKQALEKEKSDQRFLELQKSIKLPKEKAKEVVEMFKEIKSSGVKANDKALELALRATGAMNLEERQRMGELRANMSIPPSGVSVGRKTNNLVDVASDDKKWEQFRRNGYKMQ